MKVRKIPDKSMLVQKNIDHLRLHQFGGSNNICIIQRINEPKKEEKKSRQLHRPENYKVIINDI